MNPSEAAPSEPEIFKKSTNLGMTMAANVTIKITSTLSE